MRADMETYVFQDNLATAMRRDGEVYAAMVNDLYDVPRTVLMTLLTAAKGRAVADAGCGLPDG